VLAWNAHLEVMTGFEADDIEQLGLAGTLFSADASLGRELVLRALRRESLDERIEIVRKQGDRRSIRLSSATMEIDDVPYVVATLDDLTETAESQKLECLGDLAGGIAHEFNNLLTTILGYSNLASEHAQPIGRSYLQHVEQAARRAGEMCRQMLMFAGKHRPMLEAMDLNVPLRVAVASLADSLPRGIELRLEPAPQLPFIRADGLQLHQVVLNLAANAVDAYCGQPGVIRLRTGHGWFSQQELAECREGVGLPPGDYAWLEVADEGAGMEPAMTSRIFDPFFSTKFAGRGLGLAAVLGIVRSHRAAIRVHSELGRGSAFRILLPAVGESVERRSMADPERELGAVLIADDEETVRRLCRIVLESAGFEVIEAADGREAIECFEREKHRIRLAILDIMMPEKDGAQVLREMREQAARFPVLLTSGYAEKEIDRALHDKGPTRFLPKPFVRNQLLDAIRAMAPAH